MQNGLSQISDCFAGHNSLMLCFPISTMPIRGRISVKSAFCLDPQCGTPVPTGTAAACTGATTGGARRAASATPATAWRPTTRPVKVRTLRDTFHRGKRLVLTGGSSAQSWGRSVLVNLTERCTSLPQGWHENAQLSVDVCPRARSGCLEQHSTFM